MRIRRQAELPRVDLGWVAMHDHFLQTVGASGGAPLGELLVLADATFAPRSRFPLHAHRDVEIVSLVVRGTLTHHEPGVRLEVPEGGAQVIDAGQGVIHAEGNDTDEPVRMLQIWRKPRRRGGPAEHRVVPAGEPLPAWIEVSTLAAGERLVVRPGYLLVVDGEARLGDASLGDGDGVELDAPAELVADSDVKLVWLAVA